MASSNTCCNSEATRDLAIFGALVAVPPLLGLNRGIWALTTAFAVGKLATSMRNQSQAARSQREQPHSNDQSRPRQSQPQARAPERPPQPPHHTPSKGGLDHIEGAGSGPMEGAAGVAVIR